MFHLPQALQWLGVMPSAYLLTSMPPDPSTDMWFLGKVWEERQSFSRALRVPFRPGLMLLYQQLDQHMMLVTEGRLLVQHKYQ